jgi:hypothetical protein
LCILLQGIHILTVYQHSLALLFLPRQGKSFVA